MISYRAAHNRVRKEHGSASTHLCVSCGGPAKHWAYDHEDPDQVRDVDGRTYSTKTTHYRAMCPACHVDFDMNPEFRRIRLLVIARPCERCGADPGECCRAPSGRIYKTVSLQHASRMRGLGLYEMYRDLHARHRHENATEGITRTDGTDHDEGLTPCVA